jgi:hypothetical protein
LLVVDSAIHTQQSQGLGFLKRVPEAQSGYKARKLSRQIKEDRKGWDLQPVRRALE